MRNVILKHIESFKVLKIHKEMDLKIGRELS